MTEFLGGTFDVSDWIRDRDDGIKVVSTALLLNRLAIWRQQALDAGREDAEVELLLEQDFATAYVAISHVWADALYGANSSAPKPFWIDTMRIPVGEEFRKQRNKAVVKGSGRGGQTSTTTTCPGGGRGLCRTR